MRSLRHVSAIGIFAVITLQAGGCGGLADIIPEQTVDFGLGSGLGEFEVQADQPAYKTGTGSFDLENIELGRGSVQLDPDAITVTPADATGDKGSVNLQNAIAIRTHYHPLSLWAIEQ